MSEVYFDFENQLDYGEDGDIGLPLDTVPSALYGGDGDPEPCFRRRGRGNRNGGGWVQ